jgi:hypothetical protein
MAMAAGELFDDFLEIDKQVGDKWKARPQIIQKDADHLLRILRTLVYELRLGPKASEQRLMRLTKDMQQSIILLSNENKRAVFFRELRENYDFYDKIIIRKNRLNNKELDIRKLKISAAEKDRITKLPVPDFFGFYEPLQCLVNKEKGADANLLLRTLFIMLDPFGKTAQYLTLYDFKDSLRGEGNTHDIILTEPITVEASGPRTKLIIYSSPHADITLSNTDDVEISPLLELSDRGAILPSWALSANSNNTGLDYNVELIAKNLHSDRHEITVIFNPKIKKWEIHDDARKATFSDRPDISLYMDDLLYFARKN